jgi:uncharacterized protein involved in exopolysaccharide biosynthesis
MAEGSSAFLDIQARLQTYTQMVDNPDIARTVLNTLEDQLPEEDRSVATLLEAVEGAIAENSDAVRIKVTYSNPELSAEIANQWADAYVQHVNQVYSSRGRSELLGEVQSQVEDARAAYAQAQEAYENYLASSQISALQREIDYLGLRIEALKSTRDSVLNQQTQKKTTDLELYYQKLQEIEGALKNARAMQEQVQEGGDSAADSNSLALLLLKTDVFVPESTLQLEIQPQISSRNAESTLNDLEGFIGALEQLKSETENDIQALEQEMLSEEIGVEEDEPLVNLISTLESRVTELEADRAKEQATRNELTRIRDLTWQTYDNLVTKQEELKVEAQTANAAVSVANRAVVPAEDMDSGVKNVAYAVLIGGVLSVFAAYFMEFWWNYKGIDPHPITLRSVFL